MWRHFYIFKNLFKYYFNCVDFQFRLMSDIQTAIYVEDASIDRVQVWQTSFIFREIFTRIAAQIKILWKFKFLEIGLCNL